MPCKRTSNIKKANASKLNEADYEHVLQLKADHQGTEIPFTDFRWNGPYVFEKVFPNNKNLVRKIGTNKTQVLLRLRMPQFTPHQPQADIRVKPQEYKPDPEVSLNNDDLYARAWDYDQEQPTLMPRTIMQRHPTHKNFQYSLIFQQKKWGTDQELHTSVPQNIFIKQTKLVT